MDEAHTTGARLAGRRRSTGAALAASLLMLLGAPAAGQELRVDASRMWLDHPFLGAPLGIGLSYEREVLEGVGVRVGLSMQRDTFEGFGTTCFGFLPAVVDCAAEPTRERARLGVLTLSAPISVIEGGRARLRVLPAVLLSQVGSEQLGLETGRRRGAERLLYGFDIGTEIAVLPFRARAVRVVLSGYRSLLHPYGSGIVADGYTPFEREIQVHRVQLGLAVAY